MKGKTIVDIFNELHQPIIHLIDTESDPILYYHNAQHTDDVIRVSKQLADEYELNDEDRGLLLLASLFHDTGYLYDSTRHEEASCEVAETWLIPKGLTELQMRRINSMIMATKLPQTPHAFLDEIICDADLDYLGRDDFFELGDQLYLEMKARGIVKNLVEWDQVQIKFLDSHHFFTNIIQDRRNATKEKNIQKVKNRLAKSMAND